MPMRLADYGPGWVEASKRLREERAQNRCEWCGAENGRPNPRTGSRVVLTCAHLPGYAKTDHRDEAIVVLCNSCHLGLDREHHMRNASRTRLLKKIAAGQEVFPFLPTCTEESPSTP